MRVCLCAKGRTVTGSFRVRTCCQPPMVCVCVCHSNVQPVIQPERHTEAAGTTPTLSKGQGSPGLNVHTQVL